MRPEDVVPHDGEGEEPDPWPGVTIETAVNAPLVWPEDIHSQDEVDGLVLAGMLDQARREYAGAKVLLELVREHQPWHHDMAYLQDKVVQTRRTVETVERLLKTGLPDSTREGGGQAPDA